MNFRLVSSGDSLFSVPNHAHPGFMYSDFSTHHVTSNKTRSHVPVGYSSTVLSFASLPSSRVTPKNHIFTLSENGMMTPNKLKLKLRKDCKGQNPLKCQGCYGGFLVTRDFINKCYFLHMINSVFTREHLGKSVLLSNTRVSEQNGPCLFYSRKSVMNIQRHRQL